MAPLCITKSPPTASVMFAPRPPWLRFSAKMPVSPGVASASIVKLPSTLMMIGGLALEFGIDPGLLSSGGRYHISRLRSQVRKKRHGRHEFAREVAVALLCETLLNLCLASQTSPSAIGELKHWPRADTQNLHNLPNLSSFLRTHQF